MILLCIALCWLGNLAVLVAWQLQRNGHRAESTWWWGAGALLVIASVLTFVIGGVR